MEDLKMSSFTIMIVLKSLDVIHDLLCPFFCDHPKKELSDEEMHKIAERLDRIESLLYKLK